MLPDILEANPLLNFFDNINVVTGEIKSTNKIGNKITPSKTAYYRGLEFKIYETGTIIMVGSLHKYWNGGEHNYNDFGIDEVREVLNDLKEKFGIDPKQCVLKCLEIGINITPPIETNSILDNCFLHKTKPFESQKNSFEGKYKQVQHAQYFVKIYNKALQYLSKGIKIETEIMRFEIKYTKMQKLNRLGIFTLQDLMDYGLHNFKKELLKEWHNVLFFDKTILANTKDVEKRLLKYSNPNYWTGLLDQKQNENFKYHKKQLNKMAMQKGNKIQNVVCRLLSEKIDFLNNNTT
ncbi:hypothetical protein RB619_05340 [Flavobacterium sp. LHD-80]|uniref:hypothetical protein n=1 Tax=Flavobacterium sp. LHD-80 TaxID=3071411 RepID=UPI0027DEE9A4|nr:hypothetical protein [Flavobacterium sp. LHD-80]MDQ6470062.1 hypothetical protein [Flavobacterium sp. LHD-80]